MEVLPVTPLNEGFNQAVLAMVSIYLPEGFNTSAEELDSFEQVKALWEREGRLTVSQSHSSNTIFGKPEVNWAFRAWHDYCHIKGDFPFTVWGEWMACYMQRQQLRAAFSFHPQLEKWCQLLDIEVNGQVGYSLRFHTFPENQIEFTKERLARYAQ